jgi:hypothetical protein
MKDSRLRSAAVVRLGLNMMPNVPNELVVPEPDSEVWTAGTWVDVDRGNRRAWLEGWSAVSRATSLRISRVAIWAWCASFARVCRTWAKSVGSCMTTLAGTGGGAGGAAAGTALPAVRTRRFSRDASVTEGRNAVRFFMRAFMALYSLLVSLQERLGCSHPTAF